jgi:hypothetical protein
LVAVEALLGWTLVFAFCFLAGQRTREITEGHSGAE